MSRYPRKIECYGRRGTGMQYVTIYHHGPGSSDPCYSPYNPNKVRRRATQKVNCDRCMGKGWIGTLEQPQLCPRCEGKKYVERPTTPIGDSIVTYTVCGGQGVRVITNWEDEVRDSLRLIRWYVWAFVILICVVAYCSLMGFLESVIR